MYTTQSVPKTIVRKSQITSIRMFAALGTIVVTVLSSHVSLALAMTMPMSHAAPITNTTNQRQLQSKVETSSGVPRSGFDPASQNQHSLASAAASPNGVGLRVDTPAAKIIGTARHTNPLSVLPDTKKTGILASGCLLAYGTPGTQCLPARASGNKPPTCDFIKAMFPNGITIANSNPLHLKSSAGKACAH